MLVPVRRAQGPAHAAPTVEVRDAWYAAAEKVQSRPRLGQSGPLAGPQLFVGLNCAGEQTGREMFWQPPQPNAQTVRAKREKAQSAPQAIQLESVTRTVSGLPCCCDMDASTQHRGSPCYACKSQDTTSSPQHAQPQRVTRPTWDRPLTANVVPPCQCRCTAGRATGIGAVFSGQSRAFVAGIHRKYRCRELWRGS